MHMHHWTPHFSALRPICNRFPLVIQKHSCSRPATLVRPSKPESHPAATRPSQTMEGHPPQCIRPNAPPNRGQQPEPKGTRTISALPQFLFWKYRHQESSPPPSPDSQLPLETTICPSNSSRLSCTHHHSPPLAAGNLPWIHLVLIILAYRLAWSYLR